MAYEVLARKWRPQQFDEVVGQGHVTRTLKNAIEANRVAHAYLFVGPRGIGKTSIARIFAKALNCEKGPTSTPCGACDSCREIAAGRSLDVLEFDAASNTQVDKVRELIIDRVAYSPARSRFKIYIVDEVHMLSASSFNALLKTLEEPPSHVKFIFATTDPQKVPSTIASRCQRFDLRRIAARDIMAHLAKIAGAEGVEISDDALLAIARGAEGGLRDAESAMDQLIAFRGRSIAEEDVLSVFGLVSRRTLEGLAEAVLEGNLAGILSGVAALDENGKDLTRVAIELLETYRNLLVRLSGGGGLDVSATQAEILARWAERTDSGRVLRIIEILIETEGRLRYALSRRTLMETALIRCARAARSVSVDHVLRILADLKDRLGGAAAPDGSRPIAEAAPAAPARSPIAPARIPAAPPPAAPPAVREPDLASAPPIPPAASPPPGDPLAALRGAWAEIVARVVTVAPLIRSHIEDSQLLSVTESGAEIGLNREFTRDPAAVDTGRTREAFQKAIERVVGKTVEISFRLIDPPAAGRDAARSERADAWPPAPGAAPAPEEPAPAPRRNVRKELLQNPGVKAFMQAFDGRITEIQE